MAALTADMLKTRSGQFDLESIQRVSLSRMALGKVEVLQQCTSLVSLDLSGNMLTNLKALGALPKLKTLDVSANRLSSLEGVEALTSLEHLNVEGNGIAELEELDRLATLVNLRSLSLRTPESRRGNPVCSHPAYFSMVQRVLGEHKLQQIDGENLLLRDAAQKLMLEHAEVDESEVKLPPSEPWVEDRVFRLPKHELSTEVVTLERALEEEEEEAKSLDAEAAVLISKIRAEAAAKRKEAKKLLEEEERKQQEQAAKRRGRK